MRCSVFSLKTNLSTKSAYTIEKDDIPIIRFAAIVPEVESDGHDRDDGGDRVRDVCLEAQNRHHSARGVKQG